MRLLLRKGDADDFCFFCFFVVVLQKRAQTQKVREFHSKSIKEKAVHLRGLFSEDSFDVLKVNIAN